MNKSINLLIAIITLISLDLTAQQSQGFSSVQSLVPEPTTASSGEKPQSKPWNYIGKWWAVFPNSSGTHLWRLDGTSWTNVLRLSSRTSSKADCKVAGDVTHILLYQGASSQLASVEYDHAQGTYKLWSRRTSTVGLTMDQGAETATVDIDGTGRMWLASAGVSNINVRWSDSPYTNWSPPITIATGVDDDDICAVIAMPGKLGVLWSNQTTNRFGFKSHQDGAAPGNWSEDEVPASQSAQNVGNGMADDHLNMAIASDGTLYCAVKTEYGTRGYPEIALLVRRPNGAWDNLYAVTERGTRPIVILNESVGRVKVIYTSSNSGGNILYKETSSSNISFSSEITLMSGTYNNATSSKANYTSDVVVMATSSSSVVGVLANDQITITPPATPSLASPANNSSGLSIPVAIEWAATHGASSYQAQVSTTPDFSTTLYNQSDIQSTSASISDLSTNSTYYWRVRASNTAGTSAWSSVWSFNTVATPTTQYSLTTSTVGSGSVTRSPDQASYAAGSTVTLTATPQAGFQFAGWSGDASGTTNPLQLVMDAGKAISATFEAISTTGPQVTDFVLVSAHTERDIMPLADGQVISLASLPTTKLNIRANTAPGEVGSVKFELSGSQAKAYTDNQAPYALHGDNGAGNYYYGNWNPPAIGTYTLRATPYTGANGTGTPGTPLTITFTIVSSDFAGSSLDNLKQAIIEHDELIAYPNPFTQKATLNFSLQKAGDYIVDLYDAKGMLVGTLQEGSTSAGEKNSLEIDGTHLARGLYFIKLQSDSITKTLKLMLHK